MSKNNSPVYYRYLNEDVPYYYNAENEETTYEFPFGCTILDPETLQLAELSENEKQKIQEHDRLNEVIRKSGNGNDHDKNSNKDDSLDYLNKPRSKEDRKERRSKTVRITGKPDLSPKHDDSTKKRKHHRNPSVDTESRNINTISAIAPPSILDVPIEVSNFDERSHEKGSDTRKMESYTPGENGQPPFLPNDIQDDIQKFQIEEYAKQYFKAHRKGHVFNRKVLSLQQLTRFSAEPLKNSLIELNKKDEAESIKCFNYILQYTGVVPNKSPKLQSDALSKSLDNFPGIRDEVYFQLIKQTRQNPKLDWEMKTWDLFLLISTIYPSSHNSENWIKSHLARCSQNSNNEIANIAQFTYIRFSTRCAIGKTLEDRPMNFIEKIPQQVNSRFCRFNASIYEHLWYQKKDYATFPIPIIVHRMAESIIEKGAERVDGIFRHPGNMRVVGEMKQDIEQGNDPIPNAQIHDLLSLFKSFFRDLPNPLVPVNVLPYLKNASEDHCYIKFVQEHLPPAHLTLLGYLVGFLARLAKSAKYTRMTANNIAIVFAPNIVQPEFDYNEPTQVKQFQNISIDFVQFLIENWDVQKYYPLSSPK